MHVIHEMLLFPVLSSRCGGGHLLEIFFCLYVFSLYACIYWKPGRFPFYKSCHVYCNKPVPLLILQARKQTPQITIQDDALQRTHFFFFPYYTCNLSLRVKIPPWHLYCLWLSYVHPLKHGFQKEISRGCKNALSGSQVSCRPGWPLGNQSHSWHFRAATKPLGNTLTQRPRFAAEMWDAQTGNRTCPKGQQPSHKIGGGTRLLSCQGGNGHEGPCLYALTTQRTGGQLMFINVTPHTSLGSPVLQGSFPPESVTHAALRVCEAPGQSPTLLVQSPQKAAAKHWPSWIRTWTANVEMGCFISLSFSFINNIENTGKTLITHTPFYVCLHGNDKDDLDINSE